MNRTFVKKSVELCMWPEISVHPCMYVQRDPAAPMSRKTQNTGYEGNRETLERRLVQRDTRAACERSASMTRMPQTHAKVSSNGYARQPWAVSKWICWRTASCHPTAQTMPSTRSRYSSPPSPPPWDRYQHRHSCVLYLHASRSAVPHVTAIFAASAAPRVLRHLRSPDGSIVSISAQTPRDKGGVVS